MRRVGIAVLAKAIAGIAAVATVAVERSYADAAVVTPQPASGSPGAIQPFSSHGDYDPVVRTLQTVIENGYHDAPAGKKIAQAIAGRRISGRYVSTLAPREFADLLTADLLEISKDAHFTVIYDESAAEGMVPGRGGRPPKENFEQMPAGEADFWRSVAYGIEAVEWREGNIGRLEIRAFARPYREVREQYANAMRFVEHTDALVIDLTDNGGGSVHMVGHFLSYFFDRPSFLTKTISWRTEGREQFVTTRTLEGPSYGERRPVVVAVSSSTFSGGEELAYSLQAFGRAILVGQKTRGGANPVATWELGDGFKVIVPTGRVRHPATGSNWERVGVIPDINTGNNDILTCADKVATALVESRERDAHRPAATELRRLCEENDG